MAIKTDTGLELEPYQVVFKPLVTEKNTHMAERRNAYAFQVHPQASKTNIKEAVEELWKVRVAKVRTQNRKGKPRRTKTGFSQTQNWKKAIVELHEEDRINFF